MRASRRPSRRGLRWLLAVVVVVVIAAVVADVVVRSVAQQHLATRVRQSTGAATATARIHSFPFLYHLLVTGSLSGVVVDAGDVPTGSLRLQSVGVDARGVRVDRRDLLSGKLRVLSIAGASVDARVTAAELSAALGHTVSFSAGDRVTVEIAGRSLDLSVGVSGGHTLVLVAGGLTLLSVDMSKNPVIGPCDLKLHTVDSVLDLSCEVSPVPVSMIDALNNSI